MSVLTAAVPSGPVSVVKGLKSILDVAMCLTLTLDQDCRSQTICNLQDQPSFAGTGCCVMSSLDVPTARDSPSGSHPVARGPLIVPQPHEGGASPDIPGELAWAPFAGCSEMDVSDSVARRRDKNRKQSEQERPAHPAKPAAQVQSGGSCEDDRSAVDSNIKEVVEVGDSHSAARRRDKNRKRNWRRKHAQPAKAAQPLGVCSSGVSVLPSCQCVFEGHGVSLSIQVV
jgi:hypothetical protein